MNAAELSLKIIVGLSVSFSISYFMCALIKFGSEERKFRRLMKKRGISWKAKK